MALLDVHLDPPVCERMHDRRRAIVDREFLENRRDVVLDGLIADLQRLRNLLVAIAPRDVVQDLDLAAGERRIQRLHFGWLFGGHLTEGAQHAAGEGWTREDVVVDGIRPPAYLTPSSHQRVRPDAFAPESRRTGLP